MGCCVIWGPWMENAQDICARLKEHAIHSNQASLAQDLLDLHDQPDHIEHRGTAIQNAAMAEKGSLKQLVHMCEPYLKDTSEEPETQTRLPYQREG